MDADGLLTATYRGDLRAFEALVRSQAARLHHIAARVTGDRSLADDVLQETFLRVLRVPAAARPSRAAATWLARVTVRVALNILDSERARRHREERYAMERNGTIKGGAPSGFPLSSDLEPALAEALASLAPETRAALWLNVVEGEGIREVAACLDSSRSTVSRWIREGLDALRGRLATSGLALAGTAALRGVLSGSEIPPPESLVEAIVVAGQTAMAGAAASPAMPEALDGVRGSAALSTTEAITTVVTGGWPVRTAVASIVGLVLLGTVAFFVFNSSSSPAPASRGIAKAPVETPSTEPAAETPAAPPKTPPPDETAPSSPAPAVVYGTIRDKSGEPVALADVYLAMNPFPDDDLPSLFFRADYFQRSRFLETKTDSEGRYTLERVPEFRRVTLGAFKESPSGPRGVGGVGRMITVLDEGGASAQIDLVITDGTTLTGKVLATDGSPVADAVLSVTTAWTPTGHIWWPAGLCPTDANGRFRLGLEAGAAGCHVRVNSDTHGQHFFLEVPVTDEEAQLTLKKSAQVKGTITWTDGAPASGLTVRVNGRLPEPPISIQRMGRRSFVIHDGLVGGDGTYVIEGLNPHLSYDIFVIDLSLGEREARWKPLSPPMIDSFRPDPGEVKVWDHTVSKPITLKIRGHIRTEASGQPVPGGRVGVRKDGKHLFEGLVHEASEGLFELFLNTGPGEYVVHAAPPGSGPIPERVGDLIVERFGKTLQLAASEEVELDLTIFEPTVLPIRVLNSTGEPVKSICGRFFATLPNGEELTQGETFALDDTGRASLTFYLPAAEFRYEISDCLDGPTVTLRHASHSGGVFPEETLILPRSCRLTATLRDASGNVCKERMVYLSVRYDDGSGQSLQRQTDEQGRLDEKNLLRADAFVLEIRLADSKALWKSLRLEASVEQVLDLGEIVLKEADD